jgi:two-component sensor histidine kinase
VRELTHRSKNLLAVVQALVHQTIQSSGSFADFQSRFFARLKALAASQDLLVRGSWRGAHADQLVRSQLAHFGEALGKQIELSGPSLFLSSEAVQALGLALHELSTNAIKYGALSVPWGKVRIAWEHAPGAGNGEFRISWRESGGPRVGEPSRSGFGRSVVERNLSLALAAKVQLEFKPEGLSWEAKLPGSHLIDASPSARPRESRDPALDTRSPLSRGQAARE